MMFPPTVIGLAKIMPRAGVDRLAKWVGPLEQAMAAFGITTPTRAAMWFANLAHESAELTQLEENMNYRAARLRVVWPKRFPNDEIAARYAAAGPQAIANFVYADRLGNGPESSGDGWAYRGRGPVGLTFRANYKAASIATCGDENTLVANPEFLVYPEFGAAAAGWHWEATKCSEAADAGNFDAVCDLINIGRKTIAMGDSNGFADRLAYYKAALAAAA
jgi:putative chitinase